eukprot:g2434.t1
MNDDIWDSQAPLSNDQFRQLLETPLSKRRQTSDDRRIARARAERKKRREETAEIKEEFTQVIKEESGSSDNESMEIDSNEEEPMGDRTLYRDRAKERREGKQVESFSIEAEVSGKTIEDTKFLGGDLEHTHLVKGLDYALLNKERAKIEKSEEESAKRKLIEEKARQQSKGFTFCTPTGRAVYNALFKPNKVDVKEFFKPGRTAFVYDFEDEYRLNFIPNVLRRPKSECKETNDYILADMDSNVVEMLATIMSYIKSSSSGKQDKKQKKKEKRMMLESMLPKSKPIKESEIKLEQLTKEAPQKVADPDDDIFADVGTDYVCDTTKKKKPKTLTKPIDPAPSVEITAPTTSIQDLMEEDEIQPAAPEHPRQDSSSKDRARRIVKEGIKEIDPSVLPDHYVECYPGFHQSYAGVVVDSDDEDFNRLDSSNKQTSRHEFETDEDRSNHKQLPKAAYQYKAKEKGGRKLQSKHAEKHRKEQKLDSQLTKIERIFKDQGHGHGNAFRSDNKQESKKDEQLRSSYPTPKNRKRIRLDQRDQS